MINVSVRKKLRIFLSTISFFLLICSQVLGDAPKSLLPKNSSEFKEGAPAEKTSQPEQKLYTGDRVNPSKPKKVGVEVNKLKEIDPDSIGTIDETSGGFHKTMWGNTPPPLIKKLLMMLPNKVYSRNLRLLYKRLILTRASIPSRNKKFNEADLLLIRAQLLFDAGYLPEFNSLIAVIPQKYQTESLAQLSTDVAFLNNNMNKACDITASWFGTSQSKYWQKTLIFCDALNGNWDQVDFGIKLLVELEETDEVFLNLIQIMSGAVEAENQFEVKNIRPRDVAMLRAARLKLPEPGPTLPAPWLLSNYIQDPGTDYQTRLLLAEEATALGVIDSLALSELYKSIPVTDEAINNAVTISLTERTPKARTLLYRATLRQQSNFGKAQAIQQAQTIARKNNLFLEMARLYAPIIDSMPAETELGWFAPEIALLHTANVNLEQAKLWSALAIREATIDQQALQNWQKVWPLIRVMWGDSAFEWNDENLIHWKNSTTKNNPENLQKVTALMYNLLYVLGEPIQPELWETLVGYSSPNGSTKSIFNNHRSIELATKKSNLAETISIILISLGKTEFNSLPPQELVLIVDSVNKLGFSKEARQLAFEILLSQQL